MLDVSISDDYGVLTTPDYGFYYGYEFDTVEDEDGDDESVWGFEVNGNNDKIFSISYDDMKLYKNCPDMWDVSECLLFGIGLFINKCIPSNLEELKEKANKYDDLCN